MKYVDLQFRVFSGKPSALSGRIVIFSRSARGYCGLFAAPFIFCGRLCDRTSHGLGCGRLSGRSWTLPPNQVNARARSERRRERSVEAPVRSLRRNRNSSLRRLAIKKKVTGWDKLTNEFIVRNYTYQIV